MSPIRPEYFIRSPKCRCSFARNALLPAMSTNADRRIRRQRRYFVVGHDLVVAAERPDEIGIGRRGEPDHLRPAYARACNRCARPNAVLLEALVRIRRARAVEIMFAEEIVDQERQHEQRPQQRLVIARPAGKGGIAADPRIGVVDRRHALPMGGGVAQAAFADVAGLDHQMRRHRENSRTGVRHRKQPG